VLDPIYGYLTLAEKLLSLDAARFATAYNFGPTGEDARPVAWIADRMTSLWGGGASWVNDADPNSPHEATYLRLDTSRARHDLLWTPRLPLESALDWLVEWYRTWQLSPESMQSFSLSQIARYHLLAQREEATVTHAPTVD
jgi:CDP-glucose 4,6-dehydratase